MNEVIHLIGWLVALVGAFGCGIYYEREWLVPRRLEKVIDRDIRLMFPRCHCDKMIYP